MINDLGIDPNEWFDDVPHPHDVMPIATYVENDGSVGPLITPPHKRQDLPVELLEIPTSVENPKPELEIKEETPHHIAYDIATSKYNPFSIGGSESIHDFEGGSEVIQK